MLTSSGRRPSMWWRRMACGSMSMVPDMACSTRSSMRLRLVAGIGTEVDAQIAAFGARVAEEKGAAGEREHLHGVRLVVPGGLRLCERSRTGRRRWRRGGHAPGWRGRRERLAVFGEQHAHFAQRWFRPPSPSTDGRRCGRSAPTRDTCSGPYAARRRPRWRAWWRRVAWRIGRRHIRRGANDRAGPGQQEAEYDTGQSM